MQRKPTKQSRGPNAIEKKFVAFVKGYPRCIACGTLCLPIAHHCEGSTFKVKVDLVTVLIGHWFIIPLCIDCDNIITHGSRREFRDKFGNQCDLWLRLITPCHGFSAITWDDEIPDDVYKGIAECGK